MNLNLNCPPQRSNDGIKENKISPMMLINEVGRLMGEKIRTRCDDNPIMQKSGRLLMIELSKKDGRTQLDLANTTHLKPPTISVALQKLEREGYVSRRPDDYDLRATRVFLTDKGKALDSQIRHRISEEEDLVISTLTDEEKETLVKLLNKIKRSILSDSQNEGDLY